MNFPVLKGTSYVLVHAPDMIIQNGTTQTTEKALKDVYKRQLYYCYKGS